MIAGSSLGAGEAALLASERPVLRAALLHGWADASHGWVTRGVTPKEKWFTLIHAHDNFFERTCHAYFALDLAPSCPLPGHTVMHAKIDPANPLFVENRPLPFGSPMLVFNLDSGLVRRDRRLVPPEHLTGRLDREGGRRHHAVTHPGQRLARRAR